MTRIAVVIGIEHQADWLDAFAMGLEQYGITPIRFNASHLVDADTIVIWGVRREELIKRHRSRGGNVLILERGFFGDRYSMTSVGWNGLNGLADFRNSNVSSDRWEKYGLPVSEWTLEGTHVVLGGQVPGDMSLSGCSNLQAWYVTAVNRIRKLTKLPVYFKPHPLHTSYTNIDFTPTTSSFEEASLVVVYSSNLAIDALLKGIPVVVASKISMAWPVAAHWEDWNGTIIRPDRTKWLHSLAYTQWTKDEIASGECWNHITNLNQKSPLKGLL